MTPLPEPNEALLKSQQKIARQEALLAGYDNLLVFIRDHIKVPLPKVARFESMCVYQREVAQWIYAALVGPAAPAEALEFLQAHWPEPPYEVES